MNQPNSPLLSNILLKETNVFYLEMTFRKVAALEPKESVRFEKLAFPIKADLYRKFYYGVGEEWSWLDRMVMPVIELEEKINADNTDIFVMYEKDRPAGFAEFVNEGSYVEIAYFGLLPDFIGKGFGRFFLQWVIAQAWSYHPKWIQLNTCSLDHPNALSVYLNAGFVIVRQEKEVRKVLKNRFNQ